MSNHATPESAFFSAGGKFGCHFGKELQETEVLHLTVRKPYCFKGNVPLASLLIKYLSSGVHLCFDGLS